MKVQLEGFNQLKVQPGGGPLPSDPTPEEIREQCLLIQSTWTELERISRGTFFDGGTLHATVSEIENRSFEMPTIHASEMGVIVD